MRKRLDVYKRQGYEDVRQAVAESLNERFGTAFATHNITMTVGAAGGLNVIFKALLNPGDEVIAFAPYFGEYRSYTNNYDGVMVEISPNTVDFQQKLDEFEAKITPKTKIVIDVYKRQALIKKRTNRITLQHLTGVQEFMGLEFQVNEHVLIPRQDTCLLYTSRCV